MYHYSRFRPFVNNNLYSFKTQYNCIYSPILSYILICTSQNKYVVWILHKYCVAPNDNVTLFQPIFLHFILQKCILNLNSRHSTYI